MSFFIAQGYAMKSIHQLLDSSVVSVKAVANALDKGARTEIVTTFVELQAVVDSTSRMLPQYGLSEATIKLALLNFKRTLAATLKNDTRSAIIGRADADSLKILLSEILLEVRELSERLPRTAGTPEILAGLSSHMSTFILLVREGEANEERFYAMTKTAVALLRKLTDSPPANVAVDFQISPLCADFIKKSKELLFRNAGSTQLCVSLGENLIYQIDVVIRKCQGHAPLTVKSQVPQVAEAPKVKAWGTFSDRTGDGKAIPATWEEQKQSVHYSDGHGLKHGSFEPSGGVGKTQIRNPIRPHIRAAPKSTPVALDPQKKQALEEVEALLSGTKLISSDSKSDYERFVQMQTANRAITVPAPAPKPSNDRRAAEINERKIREERTRTIREAAPSSIAGMPKI